MGWDILGKSMNKSRIFGKPDFGKKSRFENKLAFSTKKIKYLEICIMFRYWIFDAVPGVVAPEFIFRTDGETIYFFRPKPNIEQITNTY